MKIDRNKVAVVMLAYADFEAMEIALAAYSKFIKEGLNFYILQNGRGTYDCERTYKLAKRYEQLFPEIVRVVDWIEPGNPYASIKTLLDSEEFSKYDYICKVDDDVFPLHENWLEKLIECYENSYEKYVNHLGYVTSLVNNNPWGFKETIEIFNLKEEFFAKIARKHFVGDRCDEIEPYTIVLPNEIYTGWAGTVWANPYISRWLHKNTTFFPEKFLQLTENLQYKEVNNKQRYSINCMFFEKKFWKQMNLSSNGDDEFMALKYCRDNDLKIIADLSNPFIHLCFFTQREENRDLLPLIRNIYEKFLNLQYPIAVCPNKEYENENRLRFIEQNYMKFLKEQELIKIENQKKQELIQMEKQKVIQYKPLERIFSVKNHSVYKVITILGVKIKIKRKAV